MTASIAGIGSALPAPVGQQQLWDGFFAEHFSEGRAARAVWRGSRIRTRHSVADPRVEDLRGWGTAARMVRFMEEATPLAKGAATRALEVARVEAEEIGSLAVVSCTGYATPGLDAALTRDLGLPPSVQRLHVGHMGCFAAIPALALAADAATARDLTTLVVCAELPSLHIQPATDEIDQVLAHALFGDAVAAAVVRPGGNGLRLVDVASMIVPAAADLMAWDVTDHGFRMRLSPDVPAAIEPHLAPLVEGLLRPRGLNVPDVAAWAVHPGGPRILEVTARVLGVEADVMSASHDVLRDAGNCSSATVLLILERMLAEGVEPGSPVVAMAFGPGLTLTAALFEGAPH